MDGRTDGQTDGQTYGGDYNIPFTFLKSVGIMSFSRKAHEKVSQFSAGNAMAISTMFQQEIV